MTASKTVHFLCRSDPLLEAYSYHHPKTTIMWWVWIPLLDNLPLTYVYEQELTRVLYFEIWINLFSIIFAGGKRCTVGWGTVLQAWRSQVWLLMVSLEFFIDIILPSALWPRGWHGLQQKWIPGIFLGGKGSQCVRLTTLPPSYANRLEIWEP